MTQWDRVLDVCTGTGWTAALLAARLGAANVVTIEVDPALACLARANLARVGIPVTVVAGGGPEGWPGGAPYDLVHVTAATCRVAPAWLEQTRPAGTDATPRGPLVALTVHDPRHASDPFAELASFMNLRDQRPTRTDHTRCSTPALIVGER